MYSHFRAGSEIRTHFLNFLIFAEISFPQKKVL